MGEYLERSLVLLGLNHTIIKVPKVKSPNHTDDWRANTDLKPSVVKQLLTITKQDFVLLDADCRVNVYPELFDRIPQQYDMAVFYLDRAKWYQIGNAGKELCSGTLYFRNRPIVWEVVQKWQDAVKTAKVVEQTVLEQIIAENRKIKVYPLPAEYCWISTLPDGKPPHQKPDGPIVIEHFQASRQHRKSL